MAEPIVLFKGDSLEHYGVLGMKWGVRKDEEGRSGVKSAKEQRKAETRTMTKAEKRAVFAEYKAARTGKEKHDIKAEMKVAALGDSMSAVAKKRLDEVYEARKSTEALVKAGHTKVTSADMVAGIASFMFTGYGSIPSERSKRAALMAKNYQAKVHTGETISQLQENKGANLVYDSFAQRYDITSTSRRRMLHADNEKTAEEILDTLNADQQNAVSILLAQVMRESLGEPETEEAEHAEGSGKTVEEVMKTLTEEQLWAVSALFAPFMDPSEFEQSDFDKARAGQVRVKNVLVAVGTKPIAEN